eukprot:scaffold27202_cov108-Skeletonema_dohrnii-CCMP3373.AAC.1
MIEPLLSQSGPRNNAISDDVVESGGGTADRNPLVEKEKLMSSSSSSLSLPIHNNINKDSGTSRACPPNNKKGTYSVMRWQYACCGSIFSMTAFVLSLISTFDCGLGLVKFSSTVGTPSIDRHFGLWWYGHYEMNESLNKVTYEGCWPYPDLLDIDSKWSAARAFNILTLVGGFTWLLVNILTMFVRGGVKAQSIWMVNLLLLNCFFSGLTLIALDSNMCNNNELVTINELEGYEFNGHCELSSGANLVIASTVIWFVASLCKLMAIKSKNSLDEKPPINNMTEPSLLGDGTVADDGHDISSTITTEAESEKDGTHRSSSPNNNNNNKVTYWRLLSENSNFRWFLLSYLVSVGGEWLSYVASIATIEQIQSSNG